MIVEKIVKIPLYGQEFTIVLWDNVEEINKRFEYEDVGLYQGCVFDYDGERYIALHMKKTDDVDYPTIGLISHEAKHVVNKVFTEIGHKLDQNNDEPECYLLSWAVNTLYDFVMNEKNSFKS